VVYFYRNIKNLHFIALILERYGRSSRRQVFHFNPDISERFHPVNNPLSVIDF